MVRKAIIPAAGYGTRCLPITKAIPKEMFPLGLKPAIHYIVEEAAHSGIEELLIITSKTKEAIIDYFEPSMELEFYLTSKNKEHFLQHMELPKLDIYFKRQPFPNGLGDAIRLGKEFVGNEPFGVLLPDDFVLSKTPPLQQLIKYYQKTNCSIIGLKQVKKDQLKDYGVIQRANKKNFIEISDIIEKPKTNPPSNLAVIGRYIFTPEIFQCLENLKPGADDEIQLTDAIKGLLVKQTVYGKVLTGDRYDIGKLEEYVKLMIKMSKSQL